MLIFTKRYLHQENQYSKLWSWKCYSHSLVPGEITRRTWVRFPLGMTYQFLIIEIWLFQEETFSCQNWCICNAQFVYIYIWFENVNTWNVNEDAVIFLCDSAYLAGHWQYLNLKWIWMIVSRTTLQQWKIYVFVMHSWCIFYQMSLFVSKFSWGYPPAKYFQFFFIAIHSHAWFYL